MRHTFLPSLAFLLLPIVGTSCTASLDLERFTKEQQQANSTDTPPTPGLQFFDFKMAATSMASHTNEYFELRLVDKNNNLRGKAIYDGVTQVAFNLYLKRWIPTDNAAAPYRIDVWSDHNLTRKYDGIIGDVATKDHAWRRVLSSPLPKDVVLKGDRYEFSFLHDTVFVDIATDLAGAKLTGDTTKGDGVPGDATLLPLELTVVGANKTSYTSKKIEVRVYDKASNHLVAMHRRGRAADPYRLQVFGVLDEQTVYKVEAYVDLDEDGLFNPKAEPSWVTEMTSDAQGIKSTLNIAELPLTAIETGDLTTPPAAPAP